MSIREGRSNVGGRINFLNGISSVCFTMSTAFTSHRVLSPTKSSWHASCSNSLRANARMKTWICLCTLLLSQSVPAALIDFNDIPVGTEVSSLNPYGAAVIGTRLWVTERDMGTTVLESFTRGVIGAGPNDSPSVVMEAGPQDAPGYWASSQWNIEIAVSFQAPISTFSVDAFSRTYSSQLFYTGVDETGEAFTFSAGWLGGLVAPEFDHFDVVAPEGGYITGFYFTQFENVGTIVLAMDNLDYTTVSPNIASAAVPETIGLPTFVFTICGVLFVHRRRMRVARK